MIPLGDPGAFLDPPPVAVVRVRKRAAQRREQRDHLQAVFGVIVKGALVGCPRLVACGFVCYIRANRVAVDRGIGTERL